LLVVCCWSQVRFSLRHSSQMLSEGNVRSAKSRDWVDKVIASGYEQHEEAQVRAGERESAGEGRLGSAATPQAAYAFLQSIIDGIADPIMVIGADYRVKLMNRAARQFSSGDDRTRQSQLCYQLSHQRQTPCDGTDHPCPLQKVRESGEPLTVVHRHHRVDGEQRYVELIASPLRATDGSFEGIIEALRDITERRRAEEALHQYAQRLRALAARLAEVAETERQRLARELHDQVGQNLTALGINLNIVRTQVGEEAVAERSRLDDSLSLVEQTAERIRDLMTGLRPPVLDDYGLLAALHWYSEQFARRTGIETRVEGSEPIPRLPPHVENALFRIAQEAFTNVAKHAQATQVSVTVRASDESVRLVVEDDGIGFDHVAQSRRSAEPAWGLLTMSERAEAVGGHCRVESSAGQGTRVSVEVPR
jgi:signal transduction histidine kinase